MVGRPQGPTVARGVFPCRFHAARRGRSHRLLQPGGGLQSPIPRRFGNAAHHRGRPETPGRRDRFLLHPPHLGTEPALSSPPALRGPGRRTQPGPAELGKLPAGLLSAGARALAAVPPLVSRRAGPSLPRREAALLRRDRIVVRRGSLRPISCSTRTSGVGGVRQAAFRRPSAGARVSGPLHAPRGPLQRTDPGGPQRRGHLPVEGLSPQRPAQVPRHDAGGRRVHPALSAAHSTGRFSAHSALRPARQSPSRAASGAVPATAHCSHRRPASPAGPLPTALSDPGHAASPALPTVRCREDDPAGVFRGVSLARPAACGFLMTWVRAFLLDPDVAHPAAYGRAAFPPGPQGRNRPLRLWESPHQPATTPAPHPHSPPTDCLSRSPRPSPAIQSPYPASSLRFRSLPGCISGRPATLSSPASYCAASPMQPFSILKVGFEDRLQNQQGRHLPHPVSHRRYPQRSQLSVGFRYVHAAHRLRPVGIGSQGFLDLSNKPAHARFLRFPLFDRNAVHARCAPIGAHPPPSLFQCVPPIDPVVQSVKPELRLLLRLLMQLLSQQREFLRPPPGAWRAVEVRLFRSGFSQAALLSSYFRSSPVRPLGSLRITGVPRYYGPLRSPARAARGYVFPLAVAARCRAAPWPGLPGSSADLSLRAASLSPREVRRLPLPIASSPMSGFIPIRRTVHFHGVTRPKRVCLRCGSQVRLSGLRQTDCSAPRLIGYMLNGQFTW